MSAAARLLFSAAHKSSGKTVVTTGIARALAARDGPVATFKKGPDYIDPMWLSAATGRPAYNLDFNCMDEDELIALFASRGEGAAISLVEGNKGLHDGLAADGSDSNAALARLLGLPVVLIVDTVGMTRGIAPLLLGYQEFDPEVRITGVILNRVGGPRHEAKLRRAVETYTDIEVLGAVPRDRGLEIGERHLGLTTPAEMEGQEAMIARFAGIIAASVDLDRLVAIAASAGPLPPHEPQAAIAALPQRGAHAGLRVGVLRDAAFGFYYPDDLEAFAHAGAELVFIDAMRERELPGVDALVIGGGFPECRMEALSANAPLRADICARLAAGLPAYAECGGLMYLCEAIEWAGRSLPMVGLVPARAVMHDRPQGRGYVRFRRCPDHPWGARGGAEMRAHEFHYASLEGLPEGVAMVREMRRGHGVDGRRDGIVISATLAGFCHLRNTRATPWVGDFLDFVAACRRGRRARAARGIS